MENKISFQIAILTTSYPRSVHDEAGIFIQRLVQAYAENNVAGIVAAPLDSSEAVTEQYRTFSIHRTPYGVFTKGALAFGAGMMPNIRRRPWLIFQAPMLILKLALTTLKFGSSVQIYHAQWSLGLLAAWLCSLISGKPFIATVRGEDAKLLMHPVLRWVFWPALRRASAITSVNQDFCSTLIALPGVDKKKVHCVPNGVEIVEPSAEVTGQVSNKYQLGGKKILLFVGTVIPRKRVEALIEALAQPHLGSFDLVICGRINNQSYYSDLVKLAESLSLTQRIHFLGPVPPEDIPALLLLSFCYVSASAYEGRPNAVLEAMAAQIPVVISNIPAHCEIVKNQETGMLFDPLNPVAMAEAVHVIEAKSDFKIQLVRAAKSSVIPFTWSSCANNYIKIGKAALLVKAS